MRADWATGSCSDLGAREGGFPVREDIGDDARPAGPSHALACWPEGRSVCLVGEEVLRPETPVGYARLRGVVLWQIFRTIRQRAQPDSRADAVVEFRITGRREGGIDRYQLALIDGRGRTPRRDPPKPALTLELEPVAFLRPLAVAAEPGRDVVVECATLSRVWLLWLLDTANPTDGAPCQGQTVAPPSFAAR